MRIKKQEVRSKKVLRRGFSLVEVLLAIFILGIGMIMVASVFPVGANWTRQTTEESNAQTIVKNALSVLQVHYGSTGDLRAGMAPDFFDPVTLTPNAANLNTVLKANNPAFPAPPLPPNPFVLQAFPGFGNIPPTERAYQFGSASPFPARDATVCTYFWTALVRLNPAHRGGVAGTNFIQPSASYTYDVYILVFRKGAAEHTFAAVAGEVPGTRNVAYMPSVVYGNWTSGVFNVPNWTTAATPPIGQVGIGAVSGTVFKQVVNDARTGAEPRPMIIGGEPVILSPAADGTAASASPLVYVYQTTMSF